MGAQNFSATGSQQTFVVPSGVTSITVDMAAGQGGLGNKSIGGASDPGGLGGRLQADIAVTPGETLYINVGESGSNGVPGIAGGEGGYYLGGTGGEANTPSNPRAGGGGGGSSDIRQGGSADGDRVLAAGGGGGSDSDTFNPSVLDGGQSLRDENSATRGQQDVNPGTGNDGGGGGGGWYCGRAPISSCGDGADNMAHSTQASSVTSTPGHQSGDGYVNLTWVDPPSGLTTEDVFYPDVNDHDDTWGSDVRALEEAAGTLTTTTICSHPNSAGTTSITADPYTTRSTQGDVRADYGWGINDSAMGSTAIAKRLIPAGTWNVQVNITNAGSNITGSSSSVVVVRVYRVSAAGARSTLFTFPTSTAVTQGILGASATGNCTASSAQSAFILEADETISVGILSTHTQSAGILGGTVAGTVNVNTGADTWIQTPPPGIRTIYFRDFDGTGKGAASQQPKAITKDTYTATGKGAGTIEREWQAFRQMDGAGVGEGSQQKAIAKDVQQAVGVGVGAQQGKGITKDVVTATGVGEADRTALVFKSLDAGGVGFGTVERNWQAYRQFNSTGVGEATFGRIVTFVRQFNAVGVGTISSFRLCLDADELPEAGGGTTVRRTTILLSDD